MNARMEQRVSRLEDAAGAADSPAVDCIVLVSMKQEGADSPEIVGLSGNGIHVNRLPDEEYKTFAERAKALMRQQNTGDKSVLLMAASYRGDDSENTRNDAFNDQNNIQQKGINHA